MGMKVEVEPEERWYDSYFEIFFSSLIEAAAPSSHAERREASELHGWARDMSSSKHSPVPVPKATMSGRLSLFRYSCLGSRDFASEAGISDTVRPAGDNTVVRPDRTGACFAGEQMVSTAVDGGAAVARGDSSREGKRTTQPQGCR